MVRLDVQRGFTNAVLNLTGTRIIELRSAPSSPWRAGAGEVLDVLYAAGRARS